MSDDNNYTIGPLTLAALYNTPLSLAALYNNYEGVKMLLEAGADTEIRPNFGYSDKMKNFIKSYKMKNILKDFVDLFDEKNEFKSINAYTKEELYNISSYLLNKLKE